MITNKYITKIIVVIVMAAVAVCVGAMVFSERIVEAAGGYGIAMEYESRLFGTDEMITVDIQMEQENWDDMLKNAMSETYYTCDVKINGMNLYNVGIRTKGNTSLSAIVMDPDTDRYSFKLEFDQYVNGQTCFGLDKLILNNNYADATNMKEAVVYDMYHFLDADASLSNYAKVSVNGEYWGIYLALEAVEDSFMLRNYGTQTGELYKPESMGMGEHGAQEKPEGMNEDGMPEKPEGVGENGMPKRPEGMGENDMPERPKDMQKADFPEGFGNEGRGFLEEGFGKNHTSSRGGNGADLNYIDDNTDSYSTIWEGAVTKTKEKDHKRVVTALKQIQDGSELETYLDLDNILKYMAVHTFVVNMDSLTGNMAHNYYLYESDGQLNILPWDYNLAFGGMSKDGGSAAEMINFPVDTPFLGTQFFDKVLEDPQCLAQYHGYLKRLCEQYVKGGGFEKFYQKTRNQIDMLVETDPTAFYTYEEYLAGADMLYDTVLLRTESILGQLEGTVPSRKEEQKENEDALIDAAGIDVNVMGIMEISY